MSGPTDYYEVPEGRRLRRRGIIDYTGYRTFACLGSEARAIAMGLYGTTWDECGNAKLYDYEIVWGPHGIPKIAYIVCKYSTTTHYTPPTGQARLFMEVTTERVHKKYARNGQPIDVCVGQGSRVTRWEPVKGDNYSLERRVRYRIQASVESVPYSAINAAVGKRNSVGFSVPPCDVGTLLLVGAVTREEQYSSSKIVDFVLDYRADGWTNAITTRPYAHCYVDMPVISNTNANIGYERALEWKPKYRWAADIDPTPTSADDVVVDEIGQHDMAFIRSLPIVE